MNKEVKCPWCGETTVSEASRFENDYGHVIEERCSRCGKVLSAYLEEEGNFLPDMRSR